MLRTCTDGEIMAVSGEDPERFGEILWRHYPAVLGSTPSSAQIAEDLALDRLGDGDAIHGIDERALVGSAEGQRHRADLRHVHRAPG